MTKKQMGFCVCILLLKSFTQHLYVIAYLLTEKQENCMVKKILYAHSYIHDTPFIHLYTYPCGLPKQKERAAKKISMRNILFYFIFFLCVNRIIIFVIRMFCHHGIQKSIDRTVLC